MVLVPLGTEVTVKGGDCMVHRHTHPDIVGIDVVRVRPAKLQSKWHSSLGGYGRERHTSGVGSGTGLAGPLTG